MKILELDMQHFGMFEMQKLSFRSGMNIVCGGNETGKSTAHSFIAAMLFGAPPARGRSAHDEYTLRQPWESGANFSGSMRVEHAGKVYRIERNFYKHDRKLRVICETDGFEEEDPQQSLDQILGGMGEAAFKNTVFISQASARTDEGLAEELRRYMVNLKEHADSTVRVEHALEILQKKKRELEKDKKEQGRILDEKIDHKRMELKYLQEKKPAAGSVPERKEEPEEAAAEYAAKEPEDAAAVYAAKEPEEAAAMYAAIDSDLGRWMQILCLVAAGLSVCCGLVLSKAVYKVLMFSLAGLAGIFYLLFRQYKTQFIEDMEAASREREDKQVLRAEQEVRDAAIRRAVERETHREFLEAQERELEAQRMSVREELKTLYLEADRLSELDEDLDALDLAMMRIREISSGIYREAGTDFAAASSRILEQVTQGRYEAISLDEKMSVRINTPDRLLHLEQVSFGTMNQIYFALRMAAGELLTVEEMPIVLDETFSMYDDERLEEVLRWLDSSGKQVILFSCQTREQRILRKIREHGA